MEVSRNTLQRLPLYRDYLGALPADTVYVSAAGIARELGLHSVQVRKDLAAVSTGGRPRVGYLAKGLMADIEGCLGCGNAHRIAIVGMGHLGRALAHYNGFQEYGQRIVAVFDADRDIIGSRCMDMEIQPAARIPELCRRLGVETGVIAVPVSAAREVCGLLVEGGVDAIWNFAPTHLDVPPGVLVQNENMAASLAILSKEAGTGNKKRWDEERREPCGGMSEAPGIQL